MEAFRVEQRGDAVFIQLLGEITLEITGELKVEIDHALRSSEYVAIVLDLSGITFMDSSGIGFLVALNTKTIGQGKKMHLFKPSAQVVKTLELVQLSNFFHILQDEDELETVIQG